MERRKVFRSSGCLVTVGACFVAASVSTLVLAVLLGASLRTTPEQMKIRDAEALLNVPPWPWSAFQTCRRL
jgi:hypothetical protein